MLASLGGLGKTMEFQAWMTFSMAGFRERYPRMYSSILMFILSSNSEAPLFSPFQATTRMILSGYSMSVFSSIYKFLKTYPPNEAFVLQEVIDLAKAFFTAYDLILARARAQGYDWDLHLIFEPNSVLAQVSGYGILRPMAGWGLAFLSGQTTLSQHQGFGQLNAAYKRLLRNTQKGGATYIIQEADREVVRRLRINFDQETGIVNAKNFRSYKKADDEDEES